MLSAATDDLGLNVCESSESGGFRVLKRVFDGGVGGRKLSLGLASWKSVPLICCCVWGRRWEAGLRNDLCIGMRTAEAGTDEEALWLGPDGVEEGSGEGIRRKKKSNSWTEGGCGPLDHVSKLPSTAPTTQLADCQEIQMLISYLATHGLPGGQVGKGVTCKSAFKVVSLLLLNLLIAGVAIEDPVQGRSVGIFPITKSLSHSFSLTLFLASSLACGAGYWWR